VTLSIVQKLQILLIRVLIAPAWFLDVVAGYTYKRSVAKLVVGVVFTAMITSAIYFPLKYSSLPEKYRRTISTMQTGIVDHIFGSVILAQNTDGSMVLGTSKRVKRPVLVNKSAFPYITAKAHLIIDNGTGTILSEHTINTTFAPASTTKLMTALVASDIYNLGEIIEISAYCSEIDSTKLWLPVGSKYTVKDLLYSLLVSSAGDAGCALASSKLDMQSFVDLMNEKAAELDMTNSHFTNPVGLDGFQGSHYSSVWDLYLLSKKVMESPFLREVVRTKNYSYKDVTGALNIDISNTNQLLWDIPETVGIKTGRTSGAGEVLIYDYKDDDKDFTIIVMSSDDRFLDTRNLINWTLSSYEWR